MNKDKEVSHSQLVKEAAIWLKNTRRCSIVCAEITTAALHEIPDALGWGPNGVSILIECKTSRSDFLRDKEKFHRNRIGMGMERWFYAPEGIIKKEDLENGWGLLERKPYAGINGFLRHQKVMPVTRPYDSELLQNERRILISIAWRVQEAAGLIKNISASDVEPEFAFDKRDNPQKS